MSAPAGALVKWSSLLKDSFYPHKNSFLQCMLKDANVKPSERYFAINCTIILEFGNWYNFIDDGNNLAFKAVPKILHNFNVMSPIN